MVTDYGHLIVDECHHLSAASFELVARRSKARYVVGLSATVARKDGHHPIISCNAALFVIASMHGLKLPNVVLPPCARSLDAV